MIRLCRIEDWRGMKVLEPACGFAPFSKAISILKGNWKGIVGVDIDPNVVKMVKELYPEYDVRLGDFLLMEFNERFDLVIGNPPYGIIGDKSHYPIYVLKERKKLYKSIYKTWRGKYNIYGLFIEKSVNLLKDGGILCFIIPATWMILDEFKLLRAFLAENGRLRVYYLGKGVFKGVNVVTVILILEKGRRGLELYDATDLSSIKLNFSQDDYMGDLITFKTPLTDAVEKKAKVKLGELFEIKISPRSPEIKACEFLRKRGGNGYLPLLTGKNLKRGKDGGYIDYETCYSGYYIRPEDIRRLRSWFTRDRIVVGHTKGGRIVAALEDKHYAWTGDVYHLMPYPFTYFFMKEFSLQDVVKILNSRLMNQYVRDKYREISPHITKTQLKLLPLLPLEEIMKLEKQFLGR